MQPEPRHKQRMPRLLAILIASVFCAGWETGAHAMDTGSPGTPSQGRAKPTLESGTGRMASNEANRGGKPQAPQSETPSGGMPSSYLIMPSETLDEQPVIKSGCWARIYDDRNFTGGALTLSGPLSMPSMLGPFGINWKNRVKSIELGKTAVVTIFDNVDFSQQIALLDAGKRIPDLSKEMGYFDDFSSLKLSCRT